MNTFRSHILKRKKKKAKHSLRKLPIKYFFKCHTCGSIRKFSSFLDAYSQGYYLPCSVYCPNVMCRCSMTEISISKGSN